LGIGVVIAERARSTRSAITMAIQLYCLFLKIGLY